MASTEPRVAYSRTGPGHRSNKANLEHATVDGVTTLCGLREIGGVIPIPFKAEAAFSCQRCARAAITKADRGPS